MSRLVSPLGLTAFAVLVLLAIKDVILIHPLSRSDLLALFALCALAVLCLVAAVVSRRLPSHAAPVLTLLITFAAFAAVGVGMVAGTAAPWDVAYFPLVMAAAGALQVRWGWFGATVTVGWALFVLCALHTLKDSALLGWTSTLVVATVVSLVAHYARRHSSAVLVAKLDQSTDESFTDPLTGLLNRRGVETLAAPIFDDSLQSVGSVTVSFCDVDKLKPVNDVYGHDSGDALICGIALALRTVVRSDDLVGRWGGDEFVVVSRSGAMPPAVLRRRVTDWLVANPPVPATQWQPGVTVGQATAHAPLAVSLTHLVEAADQDMYLVRQQERSTPPAPMPDVL